MTFTNTMGMVLVVCWTALSTEVPLTTTTSGASATNSAAIGVVSQPIVHSHIVAVCPAQLLQPLQERRDADRRLGAARREIHHHPDSPHPFRLLRRRRERPSECCGAEQRHKISSFQRIVHVVLPGCNRLPYPLNQ